VSWLRVPGRGGKHLLCFHHNNGVEVDEQKEKDVGFLPSTKGVSA